MTQKELLYYEDAINHEKNVIAILEESNNMLEDNELISFIEGEIKIHNKYLNTLTKELEVLSNEG